MSWGAWLLGGWLLAFPSIPSAGATKLLAALEHRRLASFLSAPERCAPERATCVGLTVHIVMTEAGPVVDGRWLARQIAAARARFEPIGVDFEIVRLELEHASRADISTRAQRDTLGRHDHTPGTVHLYLVRTLEDVDAPGSFIRGVHWRDRQRVQRRWIILAAQAAPEVLAHELGHFFGLPHSTHPQSLMNKRPGLPPWSSRVFVDTELDRMSKHRDSMLHDRTLVPRSR